MPKPTNKRELIASMQDGYAKLNEQINKLSAQTAAPFNFPSDSKKCGSNERMGWSGDISVFSRTAVNMADVDEFLRKHMQAIRDVQTPDGRSPDIAPIGGGFRQILAQIPRFVAFSPLCRNVMKRKNSKYFHTKQPRLTFAVSKAEKLFHKIIV